jgi:fructokinase
MITSAARPFRVSRGLLAAATVAGTGLTAVDRIYAAGRPGPLEALGGSCGNVLVSLAMLGHSVTPLLTLGADPHGDYLHAEFKRAGCNVDLVFRKYDRGSPVIVEYIDPERATHRFSFRCPETDQDFPRWRTIGQQEVHSASGVLRRASVFYADRLSAAIVEAMEQARGAGALVFFEPASKGDDELLARALRTASIVKLSDETASDIDATDAAPADAARAVLVIRTHGARGLTASFAGAQRFFPSLSAPRLVDPCGSGDMVTTGLLDHLLRKWETRRNWTANDFHTGIETGQRLAALNCAFAGARGVFHALGGEGVRSGLDECFHGAFLTRALAMSPYEGYSTAGR